MNPNTNTNTSDEYCLKQIDKPDLPAEPLYFCGVPEECDLCSSNILTGHFFADCNIPGTEAWGYLCSVCIEKRQVQIGWGNGQLYQRQTNDKWLLVAGFPEE